MRSTNEVQQIGLSIYFGICREVAKLVLHLTLFVLVSDEMSRHPLESCSGLWRNAPYPFPTPFILRTIWTSSLFSQMMLSPCSGCGLGWCLYCFLKLPWVSGRWFICTLKYWLRKDLKHSACPISCRTWATVAFCSEILKTKSDYINVTQAESGGGGGKAVPHPINIWWS